MAARRIGPECRRQGWAGQLVFGKTAYPVSGRIFLLYIEKKIVGKNRERKTKGKFLNLLMIEEDRYYYSKKYQISGRISGRIVVKSGQTRQGHMKMFQGFFLEAYSYVGVMLVQCHDIRHKAFSSSGLFLRITRQQ